MKRVLLVVLLAAFFAAGCGGVWVNAEYRVLLDKTTAWSEAVAKRGEVNEMTLEEAVKFLRLNATLWRDFQDASVGAVSTPDGQSRGTSDLAPDVEVEDGSDLPHRLAITGAVAGGGQ